MDDNKKNSKKIIRIHMVNLDSDEILAFNSRREDGYKTCIDNGFEDLDMVDDMMRIQMYKDIDVITLNNNKYYKVIHRVFQPCVPQMLILYVKEIEYEKLLK